jgi:hypothetical protein
MITVSTAVTAIKEKQVAACFFHLTISYHPSKSSFSLNLVKVCYLIGTEAATRERSQTLDSR